LTTAFTESDVLRACQTLFGPDIPSSRSFLFYVQPSGAKSAYRRKAKETHPDIAAGMDPLLQKQQSLLFVEILKAYEILNAFFEEREKGFWTERCFRPQPRSDANRPNRKAGSENFAGPHGSARYRGRVPNRPLEIGQYLYYRGYISYQALIEALTWQRNQRPVIGDIAVRWGWLSSAGIQQIMKTTHVRGKFGERAASLGLLSLFQVKTLLFYQRSRQERLGKYFVSHGILTEKDVERAASELREHNSRVLEQALKEHNRGFHA
jgi:hypothetical protein